MARGVFKQRGGNLQRNPVWLVGVARQCTDRFSQGGLDQFQDHRLESQFAVGVSFGDVQEWAHFREVVGLVRIECGLGLTQDLVEQPAFLFGLVGGGGLFGLGTVGLFLFVAGLIERG